MKKVLVPNAGQYTITRHLPKTGQVTSYQAGDDGAHEKGWWPGRLNANNRERWIVRTIGVYDVVVDRATGLMWPKDWTGPGGLTGATQTWTIAITWADGLNFCGFTDWRIPNITELFSLIKFSGAAPFIYQPPFINVVSGNYWSGTTHPTTLTSAFALRFNAGVNWPFDKGTNCYVVAVRDSAL